MNEQDNINTPPNINTKPLPSNDPVVVNEKITQPSSSQTIEGPIKKKHPYLKVGYIILWVLLQLVATYFTIIGIAASIFAVFLFGANGTYWAVLLTAAALLIISTFTLLIKPVVKNWNRALLVTIISLIITFSASYGVSWLGTQALMSGLKEANRKFTQEIANSIEVIDEGIMASTETEGVVEAEFRFKILKEGEYKLVLQVLATEYRTGELLRDSVLEGDLSISLDGEEVDYPEHRINNGTFKKTQVTTNLSEGEHLLNISFGMSTEKTINLKAILDIYRFIGEGRRSVSKQEVDLIYDAEGLTEDDDEVFGQD